jgi:hypothetical protein
MVPVVRPVALVVVLLFLTRSLTLAQPQQHFMYKGTQVQSVAKDGKSFKVFGQEHIVYVTEDAKLKVPGKVLPLAREELANHLHGGDVIDASGVVIDGKHYCTMLTKREKK